MNAHLCDSNVWLALTLSAHVHHNAAREWLATVQEPVSVFFCRATQHTLIRLLTNAAVLAPYGNPPLTNQEAWNTYVALTSDDRIALRAEEPAGLEPLWKRYAVRRAASPKLWMDAYLAAFATCAGMLLVSTDSAFGQFDGLDLLHLG